MVKNSKTNSIISLWSSYYMPQNSQNTIRQTALKHYNQFISVRTEALRQLQIIKDTGKKLKLETTVKERDQLQLYSIKIDVLNTGKRHSSDKEIITLPTTPIINSYFNKQPMSQ